MKKHIVFLAMLCFMSACGGTGTGTAPAKTDPISVSQIGREYKDNEQAARTKYDGKEVTVRGHSLVAPIMPTSATDEGLIALSEKDGDPLVKIVCHFKQSDEAGFKQITGDQFFVVKGTFQGADGPNIKNCKFVEIASK